MSYFNILKLPLYIWDKHIIRDKKECEGSQKPLAVQPINI